MALWAHEHSYERLWPVYNRVVMNGSFDEPYTNPKAIVHVTTGSAVGKLLLQTKFCETIFDLDESQILKFKGCREERDDFIPEMPYWSAFRSNDYGYSRLFLKNKTHLHLEQVSDDQNGRIIDDFWIVKDSITGYMTPGF